MKPRYIIGGIIIVSFLILAFVSFDSSQIEYSTIDVAMKNDKTVQIIGKWLKDKPSDYNPETNLFTFWVEDEKFNEAKVLYTGMRPNNFDIADHVVLKGKFDGDAFECHEILTKCPSKYEMDEIDDKYLN